MNHFLRTPAVALIGLALIASLAVGCTASQPRLTTPVAVNPDVPDDPLARRIQADPVAVLQSGLDWYNANVKDYTCTLYKRERLDPKAADFLPEQKVLCKFKESPFSIFTDTVENPRGATRALYVEGKWDNQMWAKPAGLAAFLPAIQADPRGAQARANTLRFIDQFGFKRSLATMIPSLTAAQAEGLVQMQVVGASQVGGRDVLVVDSVIREAQPSGRFEFPHTRLYLDREWLLPVGVDLWDAAGIERGQYRFTEIKFNVGLTDADFERKACGL